MIPCATCNKVYIGETHRGLETRIKEHKSDIRHGRSNTGLAEHMYYNNHDVQWANVKILKSGLEKTKRKAMESAYIAVHDTMNVNIGSVPISKLTVSLII